MDLAVSLYCKTNHYMMHLSGPKTPVTPTPLLFADGRANRLLGVTGVFDVAAGIGPVLAEVVLSPGSLGTALRTRKLLPRPKSLFRPDAISCVRSGTTFLRYR